MEPATIGAMLREIAVYFDLDGDRHRAMAYDRAAKSIEAANGLHRLLDEGRLEELPGIGPSIARVVGDLARRGSSTVLEKLRAKWPSVIVELAQLPSVGVLKARKIHDALHPADLDAVAQLARAGQLRELPGFGAVSEKKILTSIEERAQKGTRAIHIDAEEHARSLAGYLRDDPAVLRVEIAGQVRRFCEIVDHLSFAIATIHRDAVLDRLRSHGLITSIDASGDVVTARLADGMRCELHLAEPQQFGWAWIQATGSPEHVAKLRPAAGAEEVDVYRANGLPWLPPEVRDGTDECSGDDFTDLVTLEDITCAFHCHTTYSDGKDSIEAMARAAGALGMQAITITDHSAAASYAGGIGAEGLRAQHAEIDALVSPVRILKGTEADILADGTIDVPMEVLDDLDVVIASVHQRYKLDLDGMTNRLVTAMRQPFFKVWGHALGRLVLRRDPIAVRLDEVLDAVAESPAAIEINGDPYRLDLDPINARTAAARGIPFVLSSDAHSTRGIEAVRWAVAMARRARIRKSQVLNTCAPEELAERVRPRSRRTASRS
ncbi:MAG: PHP domain-containing protein [Deltaproteobacteria bacterium]|nr:PHP domain-containing protein [Deltaproteobacteria bacterium]